MLYLITAYIAVWLILFGFVASIFLRQRQLQQQLEWMEHLLQTRERPSGGNEQAVSTSEVQE